MQTFLPFTDFTKSAEVLDNKRLGKQRSEAWILLNGGWPNHPASKMWRGYRSALAYYGTMICLEWRDRGFHDTLYDRFIIQIEEVEMRSIEMPWWLGGEIHISHQSNLLRKDPIFYGTKFPGVSPLLPYIWPEGKR